GIGKPIAILPNGVGMEALRPLPEREAIAERFPQVKGRHRVLFLSRLHPKKGLANLLSAWQKLGPDFGDWCVLIAGSGEPAYEEQMRTLVKDLALDRSVVFLGPAYGDDKRNAFAAADVFALPSYSEGFSVAVLEAAAAGLPVLLTRECNFPELAKAGAAVETSPNTSEIESGLRSLLEMTGEQRRAMGRRGKELVERAYTWPTIARQMLELYRWLSGNAQRPAFVQMG
ncbi:MAG TPA: glycosyltransferase, partial [Verrucomicrobiae bacterium]|nr:glycosyltransferase [Verrucomicrobiae bacterium]